jgi:hypothetical protein
MDDESARFIPDASPDPSLTRQIVNVEETLLTSIGYRRLPDERVKTCQYFGYDRELSVRDSHVTRDRRDSDCSR